jgi:CTP:molybdopterin cytidylyltransferase MocA
VTIAFVLLAAGGGTRYVAEGHKLEARLADGATVVERSLGTARAAAAAMPEPDRVSVVVVTGALAVSLPDDVVEVRNERWTDGQAGSIRAGLDAAGDASAAVIGLADQPFVTAEAWCALALADSTQPILVATYDGVRGNPVRLDRSIWSLLPTAGDQGARALMRIRPDLVGEVPCTGSPADIDTVEDLLRWQSN